MKESDFLSTISATEVFWCRYQFHIASVQFRKCGRSCFCKDHFIKQCNFNVLKMMTCTRKYPFCLGGTVPPASEWPKLGGAKQGDQGPCWSHQQPPVFAFFGKSSHDFLTSCYLHLFASLTQTCQVQWFESILSEFMNRSTFLLS